MNFSNLIFHGNRNKRRVALTFDDGPSEKTLKLLNLLKKEKVKATFFVLGKRISGREEAIRRMIKEGHEIGNHSFTHNSLWFKKMQNIEDEIMGCDNILKDKFSLITNLFRPPYFRFGLNLWRVCTKLKKKVIFSDAWSNDWKLKGVKFAVSRVVKKSKNGSIINLHDYLEDIGRNKEIVEITERIISELKQRGYKFTTVSEILI